MVVAIEHDDAEIISDLLVISITSGSKDVISPTALIKPVHISSIQIIIRIQVLPRHRV